MSELLIAGGLLFTVPLTILAIAVLVTGIWGAIATHLRDEEPTMWMRMLFHLGLFSFVLGLFSQGIGLYHAMGVIESVGGVSPAVLAGGLKVSLIAPLYGLLIFLIALLLRFGLVVGPGFRRRPRVSQG